MLDDNEKAILFSMLPENSVTISGAFMWAFKGDMLKAAMFSRYVYCYLKNKEQPIIYKDKTIAEQYFCPEISVKRKKSELKNEGLISVVQKGIPAIGYISANIEKALEILVNFKKYQIDTSGDINLIPHTKDNNNNNNIKENIKRKTDPASGTPSSPEVDELQVYDLQFESFWDKVQYKAQKSKAYAQWKKATNNGKSQTAIKGIEEGYERYVSFLAKTKKLGFNQSHMLMSRFLNHKDQIWLEDWKTEEEQRQERNKEQQKRFFETKQREEQKQKEQQRNELEEEKRQHLIAITTKYRKYWSDVIKQRFGFDVTTDDIEQHKTDNTDYWIYFEEWCQGRYIADTIGVFTKKGMDYDAIEECFDKRIKTKNTKKTSYRP